MWWVCAKPSIITAAVPYDPERGVGLCTIVDRRGTSSKWEGMYRLDPQVGADIVLLSVADMEFVEAPFIRNALIRVAQTAVLGYTMFTDAYYEAVVDW